MNAADLASQIYEEWESPTDTSAASIATWLSANIGLFNARLNTAIVANSDGSFTPDLDFKQAAIYKKLYDIYRLNLLLKRNLGATAYDWSELTEGDSTVRRVSKNTIAQTYRTLIKDAVDDLNKLLQKYQSNAALPVSLGAVSDVCQFNRVDL